MSGWQQHGADGGQQAGLAAHTHAGEDIVSGTVAGAREGVMTAASSGSAGAQGAAPQPSAGDQHKFLRGDATWKNPISVAIFVHQQNTGTDGGSLNSGAARTVPINTEKSDPDNIATISGNQVTITNAGVYRIRAWTKTYKSGNTSGWIQDITAGAALTPEATQFADTATADTAHLQVETIVTITASNTYELQVWSSASQATNGFGTNANVSGKKEIYAYLVVELIG